MSRVGCGWGLVVIELVDVIKKDGEVVEVKVKNTPIEEAPKPKSIYRMYGFAGDCSSA